MFTDENWRAKMQGASTEIDMRFGERLTICLTERKPNFAPRLTDNSIIFDLRGVFSYRSEQVFKADSHTRQAGGLIVESRRPIITISHRACPYSLQAGDVLTRCCDGTQWEITSVAPDGVSRITLDVIQRGLQNQ